MEREQRVSVCFHALPYVAKSVERCVWVIENRDIWRKGVQERISYRGWYIGRRVRETGRRHETHSHCTSFQPSFATTLRPFFSSLSPSLFPLCSPLTRIRCLSSLKGRAPFAASLSPASITLVLEFSSASENSLPFFPFLDFRVDRPYSPQNSLHSLVNLSIAFQLLSANLFGSIHISFPSRTTRWNASLQFLSFLVNISLSLSLSTITS